MKHLPWALAFFRLFLGVVLPFLAYFHISGAILAVLFVLGFLSDIADGVIARALAISTLGLRRFDSRVDLIFLIGSVTAVGIFNPKIFQEWLPWLYAYAFLFLCRNALDFWKYRASPSYHMWSGKLWTILVAVGIVSAFLQQSPLFLPALAFAIYAWNAIEGMIATLLLPQPMADIRSLAQVFQIYKSEYSADRGNPRTTGSSDHPPFDS